MNPLQIVIEAPQSDAAKKRPRLVTSCDHCRLKKIKCVMSEDSEQCEGCAAAKVPCQFRDREQYFADRSRIVSARAQTGASRPQTPNNADLSQSIAQPPYAQVGQLWQGVPVDVNTQALDHSEATDYHGSQQSASGQSEIQSGAPPNNPIFDPMRLNHPHPVLMTVLLQAFFDHLRQEFPFFNYEETTRQFVHQSLSPLIENCIAAHATPYTTALEIAQIGVMPVADAYLRQAKIILSSAPLKSVDTLRAVIMLAWAEYKRGHISDFRAYAEMAMRIATHLGLTDGSLLLAARSEYERQMVQALWTSVVQLSQAAAAHAQGAGPSTYAGQQRIA